MAAATTDVWWEALEKSNLLTAEQLAEARRDANLATASVDAKHLAEACVKRGLVTRWQAEQLLAGRTNLFLGRYRLEKRIGKGGMGAVYKAQHTVMGRAVALKVMAPALVSDATAVARFRREVESAAKLNHPNIVSAYDADCVGKTHFLVMEYIDGPDLKNWFDRHAPLPIPWVCECIRQAAVGLQYAHEHGMVHRDLKPSNLLVTSDKPNGPPVIKILDMGLARFISSAKEDEGLTQSGQIMGTPDYIAPEQAEDTKRADIRSDIFSLGCTLFYLLTGELPFRGETVMAKLLARIQNVAPPIRTIRQEVPVQLEAAIAKMLSSDPAARQQTPAEVVAALTPYAANVSAGTAETISLAAPVEIPTMTSVVTPGQPADTAFGDVLANLVNRPDQGTRHGGKTMRTRSVRSDPQGAGTDAGSNKKPTIPKWAVISAVTAVLVVLVSLGTYLGMNRSATVSVTKGPSAAAVGNPAVPGSAPAANTANAPAKNEPEQLPELGAAAAKETGRASLPDELTGSKPAGTGNAPPEPPNAPEPKTAPDPASSNVAAAKSVPADAAPSRSPQTHIVGPLEGQLPDLKAAFEKAGPGDTILIRHRGPLEFAPADLTGKTPLSIVGDSDNGSNNSATDFWPILRQAARDPISKEGDGKTKDQNPNLPGLFFANQLDVTFRKLHLVAGGPNRDGLRAVFSSSGGRVELDHCTVTVGVDGFPGDVKGTPLPLFRTGPPGNAPISITMSNSFLRGLRLQSCIATEGENPIDIQSSQTIWAGGAAPWIVARGQHGPMKLALHNCTIYNVPNLLHWESLDVSGTNKPQFEAQTEKCVFVGPFANKEPLVAWNPGVPQSDLPHAAADGRVRWTDTTSIYHRYGSFFSGGDPRKPPALEEWRKLWVQSGPSMARQADPMFRVWPVGYELQESFARDFQPRFFRSKSRGSNIEPNLGADHTQIPHALVSIVTRPTPAPEIAAKPRGVPRVLRVHQKEGPHKTLEEAFAAAGDGDIIEIASDGPFVPTRDFGQPKLALASAETAVIPVAVPELSVRSTEDARPIVILDERKQRALGRRSLVLFYVSGAQYFSMEGIHFHLIQSTGNNAGIAFESENKFSRWINCSFTQANDGVQTIYNWVTSAPKFHALFATSLVWIENNSYNSRFTHDANLGSQGPGWLLVRNCLSVGPFLALSTYAENDNISAADLSNCSVFGQFMYLNLYNPEQTLQMRTKLNLAVQTGGGGFVTLEPSSSLPRVYCDASENCISWAERPVSAAERESGLNQLLSGPLQMSIPAFEGSSTTRDMYRPFRLKRGQHLATLAADGGPVGVRFEYLPELPAQLPTILQSR